MPPRARAFYVKLGAGGEWADDSINHGLLRFGWRVVPLAEMRARDWTAIRARIASKHSHKGTVSMDTARLKDILDATPRDVWITFHRSRLWWCMLAKGEAKEDEISRFRRTLGGWSDTDKHGRQLLINQIPGKLAQLQGFRGTVCAVGEIDVLRRVLAGEASPAATALLGARAALVAAAENAIRELHWKEYETLVDLVFRQAGWRRRSMLGETMKFVDLELEEPITGDSYQVQVKARADFPEFEAYATAFAERGYRRLYFIVHSPTKRLANAVSLRDDVELILPTRLAELIVDQGLTGWLSDRVR